MSSREMLSFRCSITVLDLFRGWLGSPIYVTATCRRRVGVALIQVHSAKKGGQRRGAGGAAVHFSGRVLENRLFVFESEWMDGRSLLTHMTFKVGYGRWQQELPGSPPEQWAEMRILNIYFLEDRRTNISFNLDDDDMVVSLP
eukprot:scaffold286_cov169-Amphora_coffeaeformis.AAC.5